MRFSLMVDEKSIEEAMHRLGEYLSEEVQNLERGILREYTESVPVYKGTTKMSSQIRETDETYVEGVRVPTELQLVSSEHAGYLERGTGPYAGHNQYIPPFSKIREWAIFRGIQNIGAMYRTICVKGTKPYWYGRKAVERVIKGRWVISGYSEES
jgi:hypothetical protein